MEQYPPGIGKQPPIKTKEQILLELEETYSKLESGLQKIKMEKALSIIKLAFGVYDNIVDEMKNIPSSNKKILKATNRRPRRKFKTKSAIARIFTDAYIASIQMNIIAATPIPRYINGTNYAPGGPAFLGAVYDEPEIIIDPAAYGHDSKWGYVKLRDAKVSPFLPSEELLQTIERMFHTIKNKP